MFCFCNLSFSIMKTKVTDYQIKPKINLEKKETYRIEPKLLTEHFGTVRFKISVYHEPMLLQKKKRVDLKSQSN